MKDIMNNILEFIKQPEAQNVKVLVCLIITMYIVVYWTKIIKNEKITHANYCLTNTIWRSIHCLQKERYKIQYEAACEFLNAMGYNAHVYENDRVKIEPIYSGRKFKPSIEQGELYIAKLYWKIKEEPEIEEYKVRYDIIVELLSYLGYYIVITGDTGIRLQEKRKK